jgi:hypothetical protein
MYETALCLTEGDLGYLVTDFMDGTTDQYVTVALDGGASGATAFSTVAFFENGPEACASGGGNAYAAYVDVAPGPAQTEVCRVLTDGGCEVTRLGHDWALGSVLWTGSEMTLIAEQFVDSGTLLQAISLDGGASVEWSAVVPGLLSDLAAAQGRILATYQRFEPQLPYDAVRTYFEVLSPGVDASVPSADAGLDGGTPDAGSSSDGGAPDAGLMTTGPDAGSPGPFAVGCGCGTAIPPGPMVLVLAAVSSMRRRSRRGAIHECSARRDHR